MAHEEATARATGYVLSYLNDYDLSVDDRREIANMVARGYERYLAERDATSPIFAGLLEALARQLEEEYGAEARGETISLGPLLDHITASICPLWPFC